jgi:dTDP-4-dehydrorhamnose reductase
VYGVSKLAGELFLRHLQPRHFLIRTCGLYGTAGCRGKGTNFVDAMVRLGHKGGSIRVVDDQWVTPTSSLELAQRLAELIDLGRFGLYHMTNAGRCTWYEFSCEIFRQLGKTPDIEAVDSRSFGAPAPRPAFSVLENRNAARAGLPAFSRWQDALGDYLRRKKYLKD